MKVVFLMACEGFLEIIRGFESKIEKELKAASSFKMDLFDFRWDEILFLRKHYGGIYSVELGLDLKLFQAPVRPYAIFRRKE